MISLFLLPDRTRLVKAKAESNGSLRIMAVEEISSYWDSLTSSSNDVNADSGISNASMSLAGLFREAGQVVSSSGEEFFIVLPDCLFSLIDCVREPDMEEGVEQYVSSAIEMPVENFSVSIPVQSRPGAELYKTIFSVSKNLIQRIVDAAGEEGVTLASIEPASAAFLRASGEFDREWFFLEAFSDSAIMVAYSPVGGMFRMDAALLSEKRLLDMSEVTGDVHARQVLAEMDMAAARTFPSANDNVNVVILTGKRKQFEKYRSLKSRIAEMTFAPEILSASSEVGVTQDWMASVGTFLQDAPENSSLFTKKPSFLSFSSGNLLPKGLQSNAKLFRITQRVKRISRILLLFGLAGSGLLLGPALYFSSVDVPEDLQARYEEMQKELPIMESELSLISKAKKENCDPMLGFRAILTPRTDALNFTGVKIGEAAGQGIWMEAELVSKDPLTFQDYVAAVSTDKTFRSVSVVQIGSDPSGYKTAKVLLRRGGSATDEKQ